MSKKLKLNWMTPKKYGLSEPEQLEQSGLKHIIELLNTNKESLLTMTNEDEELTTKIYSAVEDTFKLVKEERESLVFKGGSTLVVLSCYERGMHSVSIRSTDKQTFAKQLLKLI